MNVGLSFLLTNMHKCMTTKQKHSELSSMPSFGHEIYFCIYKLAQFVIHKINKIMFFSIKKTIVVEDLYQDSLSIERVNF
jgi:hypothetical protein